MGDALIYYIVKITQDTYNDYGDFFTENGKVIYCGIDNEFEDNEELNELKKKIKELRDQKEELLTKLRFKK